MYVCVGYDKILIVLPGSPRTLGSNDIPLLQVSKEVGLQAHASMTFNFNFDGYYYCPTKQS